MNARTLLAAVLALAVGGAVYGLWPRQKLSPEDEIRALVAGATQAAERKDLAGVVDALDPRFRGPGGAGRDETKQMLLGLLFGAQQVGVANPSLDVTVKSPTEGHFTGTFLLARDGAALEAGRYVIDADLVRTDQGWRIRSASWTR